MLTNTSGLKTIGLNSAAAYYTSKLTPTGEADRFRLLGKDQIVLYQHLFIINDAMKVTTGTHIQKETDAEKLMRTALLLCATLFRAVTSLSSRFVISRTQLGILKQVANDWLAIKL